MYKIHLNRYALLPPLPTRTFCRDTRQSLMNIALHLPMRDEFIWMSEMRNKFLKTKLSES